MSGPLLIQCSVVGVQVLKGWGKRAFGDGALFLKKFLNGFVTSHNSGGSEKQGCAEDGPKTCRSFGKELILILQVGQRFPDPDQDALAARKRFQADSHRDQNLSLNELYGWRPGAAIGSAISQ